MRKGSRFFLCCLAVCLILGFTVSADAAKKGKALGKKVMKAVEVKKKININTATLKELTALPGIGKKMAMRILVYRTEKKGFAKISELKNVSGIGDKTFDKLNAHLSPVEKAKFVALSKEKLHETKQLLAKKAKKKAKKAKKKAKKITTKLEENKKKMEKKAK